MLSGQTSLVNPSLTCSSAANYHLTFPRPAPMWPCSSFGRATVICSGRRGFEPHRGQIFSLFPCGPISFLGVTFRRYYLGYLIEHFKLPHLNHYNMIWCLVKLHAGFHFEIRFFFEDPKFCTISKDLGLTILTILR